MLRLMCPLKTSLFGLAATFWVAFAAAQSAAPQSDKPVIENRSPRNVAWKGDLSAMQKRRLIRVLVPHNRTFFFYDGLQPRGLAYEFMTEFGNKLNAGKSTNVRVHMLVSARRTQSIHPGHYEWLRRRRDGGTDSHCLARKKRRLRFVRPHDGRDRGDGPGRTVTEVGRGAVGPKGFRAAFEQLLREPDCAQCPPKSAGKPPVQIKLADEHLEDEDILELTHAGVAPITVVDAYIAKLWAPVLTNIRLHADLVTRKDANLGPIVRNDSPELKKALDSFMKTHGPGTKFGNVIIQRYTRDNRWVRNPGATEDLRRFEQALPFFQKYAKQYDFDHLLIAAQAYQESRINQKLKSPAGAVGVMQIKPTTAADPNVGIKNVQAMDANIHAGVKYLRFVSDRYFSDAKFDELNRHLFAFAAYNAGPARIQQLRTSATKQGLDPNEWFDNVEIVAGKNVGREPVDYVRNILKYWVAYRLALGLDNEPPQPSKAGGSGPAATASASGKAVGSGPAAKGLRQ